MNHKVSIIKNNCRFILIVLLFSLILLPLRIQAQFVVNSTATGTGTLPTVTLADAVASANAATGIGPHTITFDTALAGSTITAPNVVYITNNNVSINGDINGNGVADITLSGDNGTPSTAANRLIRLNADADNFELRNINLKNTTNYVIHLNGTGFYDGIIMDNISIYDDHGNRIIGALLTDNITLTNSSFTNFDVKNIGASGSGGGVFYFNGSAVILKLSDITISDVSTGVNSGIYFYNTGTKDQIDMDNIDINLSPMSVDGSGNQGIYFEGSLTNSSFDNITLTGLKFNGIRFLTASDVSINNFTLTASDGDYASGVTGLRSDGLATDISMDNIIIDGTLSTVINTYDFGIYFAQIATDITIKNATLTNVDYIAIHFNDEAHNITLENITHSRGRTTRTNGRGISFMKYSNNVTGTNFNLDMSRDDEIDDGDYGIYFAGSLLNSNFTNINISAADKGNIYFYRGFWSSATNVTIDGGTLLNDQDEFGSEAYGIFATIHMNGFTIKNMTIDGSGRAGIYAYQTKSVRIYDNGFKIENNTITNSLSSDETLGHGIELDEISTGIKKVIIQGNTISNNASSGIQNDGVSAIQYNRNLIFDNGSENINNASSNSNNGLDPDNGHFVDVEEQYDLGGGNYEFDLLFPPSCTDCTADLYYNNYTDPENTGRFYIGTLSNQTAGTHTLAASLTETPSGFLSTTLKNNALNGSTTRYAFVKFLAKAPAGLAFDLALWLKADEGVVATGNDVTSWVDQSINGNNATTDINNPVLLDNNINFKPALGFDNDRMALPDSTLTFGEGAYEMYYVYKASSNTSGILMSAQECGTETMQVWASTDGFQHKLSAFANASSNGGWEIGRADRTASGVVRSYTNSNLRVSSFTDSFEITSTGVASPYLGQRPNCGGTNPYDGQFAEMIAYSINHTSIERNQIESYLALRYGITLDQTTATSYLASDPMIKMWDETLNTAYNNDIFGIGRDDASGLHQKVSKSTNEGTIITVALDNEFVASNKDVIRSSIFSTDYQFLTFANNGKAHTGTLFTTDASNDEMIVNSTGAIFAGTRRSWHVQDTGGVGTVYLQFENFSALSGAGQYLLAVDADGDFSDGNWTASTVGTLSGENVTFAHDFADNTDVYIKVITTSAFTMELGTATSSQKEGNDSSHTINIPVNISFILGNDVTITYDTADDTATDADSDYVAQTDETITISAGSTTANIVITVNEDLTDEPDEAFTVTLDEANSTGLAIGDTDGDGTTNSVHTHTIANDDVAGITLSATESTADENGGTSTFTVVIDKQPINDVVLDLSSSDPNEATVAPVNLTFTALNWDTPQTVTITGVNDIDLGDESAVITVTVNDAASDDTYDLLANQTHTVTLIDEDQGIIAIVLAQIGNESDNPNNVPSVVTIAQLQSIRPEVTGIDSASESAYQNYIDNNPNVFSNPATLIEIQAMVDAMNVSNTVLAQIGNEGDDPDSVSSVVTIAQLQSIRPEVTGIDSFNESAYQNYIDNNPNAFSSPATQAEVQAMVAVNVSNAVLVQIGNEGDSPDSVPSVVTIAQLQSITPEVTDIDSASESAYQNYIDNNPNLFSSPATRAEVQAMIAVNASNSVLVQIGNEGDNPNNVPSVVTIAQLQGIAPEVTGIDSASESTYQNYIDNNPNLFSSPATQAEVQAMVAVNASNSVLVQIGNEGDDPNNVPSVVTIAQLQSIRPEVTGIDSASESVYQNYIDNNPNAYSNPATLLEIQAMVDAMNISNAVLAQIGNESDNPNNVPSVVTIAQLQSIAPEVTGIDSASESAYQNYIDNNPNVFSSPATQEEVQAMVNKVNAKQSSNVVVLTQIGNEGDDPDSVPSVVTIAQLQSIRPEVTGIDSANESAYHNYIDNNPNAFSSPATVEEIQAMIIEVNNTTEIVDSSNHPADGNPSENNLMHVDITGVQPELIGAYEEAIANADPAPCSLAELQLIVNEVNKKLLKVVSAEAFTPNGDGINDGWVIKGIENFPNNVIKVYNRHGREIYSANGYQNDWEGFNKANSKKLPAGSYYYIINLGDGNKPVDGWLFINY